MSDEKGGNNLLVILIVVILSVILATGSSYFMFTKLGGNNNTTTEEQTTSKEMGPTSEIGQFLVNLSDGRRFIKLNIVFELSNEKVVTEIGNRTPQVRDTIISILRNKNYEEVKSNQGDKKLRTEIMSEVNQSLLEGKVTNVFFTEFVVQ